MTADGRRDFDFLTGQWQIANRRLERPTPEETPLWLEFPSTAISRPIIGGLGTSMSIRSPTSPAVASSTASRCASSTQKRGCGGSGGPQIPG
jgi:hypothetical protein